jgi:hypothetical protein
MDRQGITVFQHTTPQWPLVIAIALALGILALMLPILAMAAVGIDSINPSCAGVGNEVTITGNGFGAQNVKVTVGGIPAQVLRATGNQATFRVPGVLAGFTTVTATNPGGHADSIAFQAKSLEMCANGIDDDCNDQIDDPNGCITCAEVAAEEFEKQAFGAWASTIEHAKTLGFVKIEAAQFCLNTGTRDTTHASAILVNPTKTPPDDRVFLASFVPNQFAFLVKVDTHRVTTLFTHNGGLRIPPGGQAEVVRGTDFCGGLWLDYLDCRVQEDPLTTLQIAACLVAIDLNLIATGATMGTAAAFLTPATIALCIDIIAGPVPPGAESSACTPPNGAPCNRGSKCSVSAADECQWGFCVPTIPDHLGEECVEENLLFGSRIYPRCEGFSSNDVETLRCKADGYCRQALTFCPDGQECTGSPGNAKCQKLPRCGDNVVDTGEQCDGSDLVGQTCQSQGYPDGGMLACTSDCRSFDTSMCATSTSACPSCFLGEQCGLQEVAPGRFLGCYYTQASSRDGCFCGRYDIAGAECDRIGDAACLPGWRCVVGCNGHNVCVPPCVQCFPAGWPCNNTNNPYMCCNGISSCYSDDPNRPLATTCH